MNTDFLDKLKKSALLVIARPDQLHILELLEDYSEYSGDTTAFLRYNYGELSYGTTRLINNTLRNEKTNKGIYIVTEEY